MRDFVDPVYDVIQFLKTTGTGRVHSLLSGEPLTPEQKAEVITTNAFDLAIDTLKNASSELKALQAKVSELETQNAEYKARFDLMTEALKV